MATIPTMGEVIFRARANLTGRAVPEPGEYWRRKDGGVVKVVAALTDAIGGLEVELANGRKDTVLRDGREAIMGALGQSPGDLMEKLTTTPADWPEGK